MSAKGGKTKRPGKRCGGSHISAAYKCRSHFTNGKLNKEGKAARAEFTQKVRSLKGLKPETTKPKLSVIKGGKTTGKDLVLAMQGTNQALASMKKTRDKLRDRTKQRMMSPNMPVLRGSPKQVTWATRIRKSSMSGIDSYAGSKEKNQKKASALMEAMRRVATRQASAKWWIDNRSTSTGRVPAKTIASLVKPRDMAIANANHGLNATTGQKVNSRDRKTATIQGKGKPTIYSLGGRGISIDSADRQDRGWGVRFAGRNTAILVDADSRSQAISKAHKKKRRGGDKAVEVWKLRPEQQKQANKGVWVRTNSKGEMRAKKHRGLGPAPKQYR